MAVAQNGWAASPDKASIGVADFTVAGVGFPGGVKSGPVATVLRYVAEQFHARVETLRPGQCWGYAYRAVRGDTDLSNHSAGTAIDINSPAHPMGKRGTFSEAQVEQIKAILRECGGVIRWGGTFTRPDEMHFEVIGTRAAVALAAQALPLVPIATQPKGEPVAHIPVNVTTERDFRTAFMAEAGTSSAVVEQAWITLGSTWGNTTMTVATLDPNGKILSYKEDVIVRNNTKVTVDVPSGTAIATVEGVVEHATTVPVIALISKARA